MAETKKAQAGAAPAAPTPPASKPGETAIPHEALSLQQKFVELRKAVPLIIKEKHSDGVSYKFSKIFDVWGKITPIMNEIGVNFDIVSEVATRKAVSYTHLTKPMNTFKAISCPSSLRSR